MSAAIVQYNEALLDTHPCDISRMVAILENRAEAYLLVYLLACASVLRVVAMTDVSMVCLCVDMDLTLHPLHYIASAWFQERRSNVSGRLLESSCHATGRVP